MALDHNYSCHWSEVYKTDNSHARPIQWLLPSCRPRHSTKTSRLQRQTPKSSGSEGSDDEIDVESLDEVMSPTAAGSSWSYDVQRARVSMNETERWVLQHVTSTKHEHSSLRSENEWEDHLNKPSWSLAQTKVFTKLLKILEDEKLARLAYKGVNNEPIARRLSLDKSAACFRRVMAEFAWDQKLAQWLHSLMINRLPPSMLASYLDLVQTLRSKVPTLVERMIMPSARESSSGTSDSLNLLLKRPWEPAVMKSSAISKPNLSDPPIILVLPNSPYTSSPAMAHRNRFWATHLGGIGKVVQITPPDASPGITVLSYLEELAAIVRSRIKSLRKKSPRRPIVLFGWHTASILSCHISLVEKVSAIICLGFPMLTLNGPRGTVDDVLCDLATPTLFVVGNEADSCHLDDLEDVREQLLTNSQTSLLAIPGADDALKVSDRIKKKACVTQMMVDKMVIDHIVKFLDSILGKRKGGVWRVAESFMSGQYVPAEARISDASYMRRKRINSTDNTQELKRRRLSSTTTAKISEVLSGQKKGQSRDGTKSPVQGVTFNLQTGSISGLTTVPTVLGRQKSVSKDTSQPARHNKSRAKGKNQARSITIDLTKDTSSQLNAHYRAVPDKALLATESQTEAAVATILGNGSVQGKEPEPRKTTGESTGTPTFGSEFASASSSAFTRPATSKLLHGQVTSTPTAPTNPFAGVQSKKVSPNSVSMTIGGDMGQLSKSKSYTNVKFSSTLISPPKPSASDTLSSTGKKRWSAADATGKIAAAGSQSAFQGKLASYAPRSQTTTLGSHVVSRSRKEERETLQATAILEKLTSSLGSDDGGDPTTSIIRDADPLSHRRHSYDATFLEEAGQGRGRVRSRDGSTAQPRQAAQKRRKTVNEERPASQPTRYVTTARTQKNPDNAVRYVMASGMSAVLSGAAAKAAAASGKSFPKPSGVAILPNDRTYFHKSQSQRMPTKPSILPVYAITPTATKPQSASGILRSFSSPSGSRSVGTGVPAGRKTAGVSTSAQVSATATQKVYVTQKVPVKFPGSVPGSNYTFVTIPALAGPSYKPTNLAKTTVVKRGQPAVTKSSKPEPRVIKYSVVSNGSRVTQPAARVAVNLRDKAQSKATATASPQTAESSKRMPATMTAKKTVLASPSVVLQKLPSNAVGADSQMATQRKGSG